jgi:LmbE family N-acetylglucosaminyl deacetylase
MENKMNHSNGLMCVLAHPDDESLALGGTLAMYSAKGVRTSVLMATRGERGWTGEPAAYPGPQALGRVREAELRAAAAELGVIDLVFLDELDGELDQVDQYDIVERIVAEIRRVRPAVVVTFGPDGVYGHPDHIAISQLTTTAVICAAYPGFGDPTGAPPHRVSKLYYRICTAAESEVYRSVFGNVGIDVAGARREWVSWPDWAITTRLDTADYWPEVRDAVACHRSQIGDVAALSQLDAWGNRRLWGNQHFFRAMSVVAVGPGVEGDLFAGLARRPQAVQLDRQSENGLVHERWPIELGLPA